jgi:predicted DNA-binding transcriptional regulator AlpA
MSQQAQQATTPPIEGDDGERFLSIADLRRRYGKSRMTIHRWVKAGYLPAPVRIGAQTLGFRLSELRACEQSWPRASPTDQAA